MNEVEILRAACCIAGLDEHIDDEEMAALQGLARQAGVGQASLNAMIDRAKKDPNFYEEQFKVVRAEAESTIDVLLHIAAADREITQLERIVLTHFAERLGMDAKSFDERLAAAERQIADKRPRKNTD